ncbi:MAG: hypothetical protein ACR2GY_10350 [Phycisphaerales bacterium]
MFTDAKVQEICKWFPLTDDQAVLLDAIHDAHKRDFQEWVAEHESIEDEFDGDIAAAGVRSPEALQIRFDRGAVLGELADEQRIVDARFMESLQAILTAHQSEQWPAFMSWLNRSQLLPHFNAYLEEPVDLTEIVNALERKLESETSLVPAEVIAEYAARMDIALKNREALDLEVARNWMKSQEGRWVVVNGTVSMSAFDPNLAANNRARERNRRLHEELRNVNREFNRIIESLLPPDTRALWRELYQSATLPRDAARAVEKWRAQADRIRTTIEDLDEAQVQAIDDLVRQQTVRNQSLYASLVRAQEGEAAARHGVSDYEERTRLGEDYQRAKGEFIELHRAFAEQLLDVLSPEQRSVLLRSDQAGFDPRGG